MHSYLWRRILVAIDPIYGVFCCFEDKIRRIIPAAPRIIIICSISSVPPSTHRIELLKVLHSQETLPEIDRRSRTLGGSFIDCGPRPIPGSFSGRFGTTTTLRSDKDSAYQISLLEPTTLAAGLTRDAMFLEKWD